MKIPNIPVPTDSLFGMAARNGFLRITSPLLNLLIILSIYQQILCLERGNNFEIECAFSLNLLTFRFIKSE